MRTCQHETKPIEPTDEELVERVRAGDKAEYGILVFRYYRRLYALALRILRNEADAEDAVQEACVLGWTRIGQFAGRASFYTWMARITINEALTTIRGRRRAERLEHAAGAPGNGGRLIAEPVSPEAASFYGEIGGAFAASVRMLPDIYQRVFAMRQFEELSTAEAAARLGVSEECVKTRLHRARELLKRRLAGRVRPWGECAAA